MDRRLALRREHLAELTTADLGQVAAAAGPVSRDICFNWPTRAYPCAGLSLDCLTDPCLTLDSPCTTD